MLEASRVMVKTVAVESAILVGSIEVVVVAVLVLLGVVNSWSNCPDPKSEVTEEVINSLIDSWPDVLDLGSPAMDEETDILVVVESKSPEMSEVVES